MIIIVRARTIIFSEIEPKPINNGMSNQYPEPPKLTSAKDLMHKPVNPKPLEEAITPSHYEQAAPGSMFPHMPALPLEGETRGTTGTTEDSPVEQDVIKSTSEEDSKANTAALIDSSETSETDVALGQVEAPEETEKAETSEDAEPVEDIYGGPWGIIKHTGYIPVALWAVLTAAVTGAVSYFFTPGDYTWIALSVLGFMTGVIAAVDRKTHLIKNQHTILTAILTVPLAVWAGINLGGWPILFGLLSAAVVFGVFIFLVIKANFGSGGDIKFSPVPAFALGVVNPLISALWLFYALIITVILLIVRKEKSTSFGEGMAISLPFAIFSVYALYSMTGLAYMEPATL
jgi:hypothetical protein